MRIVRKPPALACKACKAHGRIGTMLRFTLSRLEEGLGHEGYACDACGERVKYVPEAG